METKFKKGDVVSERIRPNQKLVIQRYWDSLYYCMLAEHPKHKELVYQERDLRPAQLNDSK